MFRLFALFKNGLAFNEAAAIQLTKLKQEVETIAPVDLERQAYRKLLICGPTFTSKQLNTVAATRTKLMNGGKNNSGRYFHFN